MVTIKRVGVASAFKVGALTFALLWIVFGILGILLLLPLTAGISNLPAPTSEFSRAGDLRQLTFISGLTTYLCGIPTYAVIGGVIGALYAIFYNLVAAWVGGIEVVLERQVVREAPRPRDSFDPFDDTPTNTF